MQSFDVVIVGAGLSGIGAAWHLKDKCAGKSFTILEARDAIGGTWDLFRYPGIRSDSDMFTLGYNFRPWTEQKAIADGPSILKYVRETAHDAGIDQHIRFRHKVTKADFDSGTGLWTVLADTPDGPKSFQCRMLLVAAGYYSYDNPHNPPLEGEAAFDGPIFHAQHWRQDVDYRNKRVVVIGSGATAVTIVPVVARDAAHVTMLQRSPTWMVSRPAEDKLANFLRRILPPMAAYNLVRWRNVLMQNYLFKRSRTHPQQVNKRMTDMLLKELPEDVVNAHFQPSYNVWDQRLCLVPDSDFFNAVKAGTASIVTDHIDHLDEKGIALKSGQRIDADIIVKATGLRLQVLGGATVSVDGVPVNPNERYVYRGMMLEGVPNLVYVFGYFNASWTLRADLTCEYACRLLNEMDKPGQQIAVPERNMEVEDESLLLNSGYVQRALDTLPRQSSTDPWRDTQDYLKDRLSIRNEPLQDGTLKFHPLQPATPLAQAAE
ncbi:NAD(P)/FAD-dependent oxidoreductase [Sandaracinobacter sp. RS1-74]|uniref:flavin-containing monooxygenase n=1 Tax=Sandaracinobacteroides sayramensis TaxID=2913411 RepID=UPI001EDC4828|nr:NAD(P)/FAD-dependent oxidoreductase [Sandaracinobacteroides sayramensis]MCG2840214.1 NAD(P)/FAD-dependent oxidoreductase [Sandaracinobacteroides sayramensis]